MRPHHSLFFLHSLKTMEALKLILVLLLVVFVQVFGALGTSHSSEDEDEVWTVDKWQGYPVERDLHMHLADLMKRSKAEQFHGLMGRSTGRAQPVRLGRKRNKGDMFVGLMGKRTLGEETQEGWQSDPNYRGTQ
ncbi:protachykinin-1-like isoform X2 [Xyrichtys novacula]|uniref:Protachykinin-1-like isoform X2 n=1 Tax=Xyrichtys novacula TaxID=13765 RepID=A0AAV1GS02_XYRNO|nr:protachykinin-1-like isoform X2 [Xyrichtys novacula]